MNLTPPTPTAIIDIGSNSVRMVVYHAASRVPMPVFNEKYACQLGAHLSVTGRLNPDGVIAARQAIARFVTLARRMHVPDSAFGMIATAAVRDASDGAAFAAEIEAAHGLKVQVISGEEEAQLAAYGILSSIHQPRGVVADLGGGSLELAALDGQAEQPIRAQHTMPLGVLRLYEETGGGHDAAYALVDKALGRVNWVQHHTRETLYAVGGSFRALAKSYMQAHDYPLDILQEYRMDAPILRGWMQRLCAMSEAKLDALPGIPSKRAALIPSACGAMEALLERLAVKEVVFSVSGVREGALFRDVPPAVQQQDPLLSSAEYHAFLVGRHGAYGRALNEWMAPLFSSLQALEGEHVASEARQPRAADSEQAVLDCVVDQGLLAERTSRDRICLAACLLSELAWTVDPNFRAEWVFWRVVQSSMKGLNHHERIQLALALYYRYSRKWKLPTADALVALLSEAERREAEMIGLAMNLAFQLSGGHSENLDDVPLQLHDGVVSIDFTNVSALLDSAVVQKRLDGLGEILSAFSS